MEIIKDFLDEERGKFHKGVVIDSKEGYDVIECEQCGFKHIIPIPTSREIEQFYKEEFYTKEKPVYFKNVEEDLEWIYETYKNYYYLIEKYISTKSRKLLEIGSGPGYFLKCGNQFGWKTIGFEPSVAAYNYATSLGVNVINKAFDQKYLGKHEKFDVVCMINVLEHVADPIGLLESVKVLLNKEGVILVVAPNDYNPLQEILRRNFGFEPWWVAPKHHINYFDFDSIRLLLERLGFNVVEVLSTFPMEFFLMSGINYVGDNKKGRECHFKRKIFEINMYKYGREYITDIYRMFAKIGIGRQFVVLGVLKN
ncbi:class I SAM-dependent methyltransferase [Hippea jasoniae]|uniref:class I SAM-dependent methyltransferase n=1 Tax=Hippea jasoniae TaxID=944479 RepID=UPI0005564AD0|nr:class I SAM-dependent methyltransferase [Hippea jasoniae]